MANSIPEGDTELMTVKKLIKVLQTCQQQDAIVYIMAEDKETGSAIQSICEKWNPASTKHVVFISAHPYESPLKDFKGTEH